jgi:hypothetical protein
MIAGIAGDAGLEGDAVSNGEALNIASALYHDPRGFVAKCYRCFNNVWPYSTVLPVMDLYGEDFVSFYCIKENQIVEERETGKVRSHFTHI